MSGNDNSNILALATAVTEKRRICTPFAVASLSLSTHGGKHASSIVSTAGAMQRENGANHPCISLHKRVAYKRQRYYASSAASASRQQSSPEKMHGVSTPLSLELFSPVGLMTIGWNHPHACCICTHKHPCIPASLGTETHCLQERTRV